MLTNDFASVLDPSMGSVLIDQALATYDSFTERTVELQGLTIVCVAHRIRAMVSMMNTPFLDNLPPLFSGQDLNQLLQLEI